jgi:tRNA A37 N6-isopentenylltransferase MiaA
MIILCEHCQLDICELCMEKHYQIITNSLQKKWSECKDKFEQINEHVCMSIVFLDDGRLSFCFEYLVVSHQNQISAVSKLDGIRQTIDERTKNLKIVIENHRQTLTKCIDNHLQMLEQMYE